MKKVFGGLVGLVVLAGIAVFLLVSNIDGIVKNVIESVGSEVTGTRVQVASVKIDLAEGKGSIKGLSIANPSNYPSGAALSFAELTLQLELASLSGEAIVISQVIVDGTAINYVGRGQDSNLKTILNNIETASGSDTDGGGPDEAGAEGEDTLLIIDSFRFTNSNMALEVEGVPELSSSISIPDVVASNVGRAKGGVTPAEAAQEIIEPLLDQAIKQAKNALEDELKDAGKDELKRQLMKKLR